MLKKIAVIPEKIYRVASKEQFISVGTYYEMNKKKIKSRAAYYEVNNNNRNVGGSSTITVDYIDNLPTSDVRIVSGHSVQIDSQYDTHVDSDFIADVAIHGMVGKNGKLKGSYVFAAIADKVKIVRVGGPLYNQIIASQDRRSAPKLHKRDFKKGGVYSTPSGVTAVYLGAINTESPSYGGKKYQSYPVKNRMLFAPTSMEDPYFNIDEVGAYNLEVKKTHSFIEMIGTVEVPKGAVQKIRDKMVQSFKQEMLASALKEKSGYWLGYKFFRFCPLLNMYEIGTEQPKKFDVNKLMTYS